MSQVVVRRSHHLTSDQIQTKLDQLAADPSSKHVAWKRQGDKILLEGASAVTKGCSGEVVLGEGFVEVRLKLSLMASMAKGLVEQKLGEELDKLLK